MTFFTLEHLQFLWYVILVVSIIFYVILDGFDLGTGVVHLFVRSDRERRILLNSIGPFWDGNEVWLIVIGGGLLVGFPEVYSVVFSGFYTLFMIFLAGIIARACSIEFRSKMPSYVWRNFWDGLFASSSIFIAFGLGLLLGNFIRGVPVNSSREIYCSIWSLFNPYSIATGILSIVVFGLHGSQFLLLKTEGELREKLHEYAFALLQIMIFICAVVTIWTWIQFPHMVRPFFSHLIFLIFPLCFLLCIFRLWMALRKNQYGKAFVCSMLTITIFILLFVIGTFPNILISSIDPHYNLTLYNSSSSETTLKIALTIAAIGIPFVLMYGSTLYSVFHGITKLNDHSY